MYTIFGKTKYIEFLTLLFSKKRNASENATGVEPQEIKLAKNAQNIPDLILPFSIK